jgi:hypothetical protein
MESTLIYHQDGNLDYLSSEKQRLVIRNVRNEFQLDFAMTDRIY